MNTELIKNRRSIRSYQKRELEPQIIATLNDFILEQKKESGLHIDLVCNDTTVFDSLLARYGKFENAHNFIVFSGKKEKNLDEKVGYFGEKILLKAVELGLGTCWVGGTYNKKAVKAPADTKIVCVISIGYIEKEGMRPKSKTLDQVIHPKSQRPQWFINGVESALYAPTALNQQKFIFNAFENIVDVQISGFGFYTKVDLGIVKYHFEIGAGSKNFQWK
ncbi:MAG: nitroreductase family protein [Treponemataceae bacterium]